MKLKSYACKVVISLVIGVGLITGLGSFGTVTIRAKSVTVTKAFRLTQYYEPTILKQSQQQYKSEGN